MTSNVLTVRVISTSGASELDNFRTFLAAFNPEAKNKKIIPITVSSSSSSTINKKKQQQSPSANNNEYHFVIDDITQENYQPLLEQFDVTVMLFDSTSVESVNLVADNAERVCHPMVSLVAVDINGNNDDVPLGGGEQEGETILPETLRAELHAHLLSLPEFCALLALPDGATSGSSNITNTFHSPSSKKLTFGSPPARDPTSSSSSAVATLPAAAATSPPFSNNNNNNNKNNKNVLLDPVLDHAIESLCATISDAHLYPRFMLWEGSSITRTVGRLSLRRSFWILDRDNDGVLNEAEQIQLMHGFYGSYSSDDIADMQEWMNRVVVHQVEELGADAETVRNDLMAPGGYMTRKGFFGVCHAMVAEARHGLVWALLAAHGVEADGRPFKDEELRQAVTIPDNVKAKKTQSMTTHQLHLSESGAAFFASLYHTRPKQTPKQLFIFTPGCPWRTVYGLPDAEESSVSVGDFVHCWRFMVTVDASTVAMYARYWNFQGDLASLFVAHPTRRFRHALAEQRRKVAHEESNKETHNAQHEQIFVDIPPTATFLVLGAAHCGVTSMMQYLANPSQFHSYTQQQQQPASSDNEEKSVVDNKTASSSAATDHHPHPHPHQHQLPKFTSGRSVAIVPVHPSANPRVRSEVCVVLRELDDAEMDEVVADHAFMETVDGVLLCYDGNDPFSFGFAAGLLPKLRSSQLEHLPVVPVLCKGDLPLEDQLGLVHGPQQVFEAHNLPWPPTIVSVVCDNNNSSSNSSNGAGGSKKSRLLPTTGLINDIENIPMILAELVVDPDLLQKMMDAGDSNNSNSSLFGSNKKSGDMTQQHRVGYLRWIKRAVVLGAVGYGCYKTATYLEEKDRFWSKNTPWLHQACLRARRTVRNVVPASLSESAANLAQTARYKLVMALTGGTGSVDATTTTRT